MEPPSLAFVTQVCATVPANPQYSNSSQAPSAELLFAFQISAVSTPTYEREKVFRCANFQIVTFYHSRLNWIVDDRGEGETV